MKFFAIAALVATTQAVKLSALNKSQEPDMPSWEEVLEAIDADGSGTISWPELKDFMHEVAKAHDFELTPEMVDEVHEVFEMVDTDGSGDVDKKEFEAAVKAHGALGQRTRKVFSQVKSKQGPPTWEEVLEVLDSDGSGTVSWPEIEDFIAMLEEQHGEKMPKEMKEEIKKVFDMIDSDGSGDIDKAEFEAAVAAHGALGQRTRKAFSQLVSKQGPPTWEEILEVLDSDASGTVSWPEIEDFIAEMEEQHGEKLPKDVKAEIKKVFDMVDTDGSGDIDKAEFEAAMAAHGALGQRTRKVFSQLRNKAKQGPPTWEEVLEVLDSDNSGTVSWPEIEDFIAMLEEQHGEKMPKEMKEEIKKVFNMIDTDGSGDIDKAEFEAAVAAHGALGQRTRKAFSQLRSKQGPPTWEEILEVLDSDASGTVSWPEIEDFIAEMEEQHGEKLPKDVKAEIKKVFDMVDTDGSGDIDKAEFEAAMAAHGALGQRTRRAFSQLRNKNKSKAKQAPEWEQVLELLDEDDSGTVSWDEIVAFVKEWEKQTGNKLSKEDKEMLKKAFEYVDQDGSGDIDKKEYEAAVASMEGLAQIKKMF